MPRQVRRLKSAASQSTEKGMRTLHEMAAAIDRALPLCEAVSNQPGDRDARQALMLALTGIADEAFLDLCEHAQPELRGLCNFAHMQANIARDYMIRSDMPDHFMRFVIGSKARDLLALLPELKKAFVRLGGA
jgi:hypothetical protein